LEVAPDITVLQRQQHQSALMYLVRWDIPAILCLQPGFDAENNAALIARITGANAGTVLRTRFNFVLVLPFQTQGYRLPVWHSFSLC
jgi:hypothetical protein